MPWDGAIHFSILPKGGDSDRALPSDAVLKKLDLKFNNLGEAKQTVRDAAKRCSGLELEL